MSPSQADVASRRTAVVIHKALRISQYFGDDDTVPQFRFSIWSAESPTAVSLTERSRARRFV